MGFRIEMQQGHWRPKSSQGETGSSKEEVGTLGGI